MKPKRVGIYVRVFTDGQDTALQEAELLESAEGRGWQAKIYRDQGHSGAKENRPALDALLADVRRHRIDVVMVWSLDRLARSLKQLLSLAEEFHSLGVDFCSHKQAIDTASAAGRLTYQVLCAVAEFERETLRERVRSGLAQARRAGKRLGRPALRRFTADEVNEIRSLRQKGASVRRLALDFKTTQFMIAKMVRGAQAEAAQKQKDFERCSILTRQGIPVGLFLCMIDKEFPHLLIAGSRRSHSGGLFLFLPRLLAFAKRMIRTIEAPGSRQCWE